MSDIALPLAGVPELPLGGRLLGDERLAKLAGRGSERAFAALYDRHHQALYRYCRSIMGNDQDAQDALQSAMMRAYAALRSQERELAVKPWLFRIAHNEAISLLRKRRPQQELCGEQERALQTEPGVEDTLERRERLAALVADLRTLPERQRAALLMRELSGLSIAQIAQAMEISSGAAKQTLFEARNSLHELAEGRAMECDSVRLAISQHDGRVLRGRRIRAHLRACERCRDFRDAIQTRSADLAAIAPPLPAPLAGALLGRLLLASGRHAPAASAGPGAVVAGHAATSLLGKGIAGAAVLAAAAAGTAHFTATHSAHHHASTAPVTARTRALRATGAGSAGASAGGIAAASPVHSGAVSRGRAPGSAATLGTSTASAVHGIQMSASATSPIATAGGLDKLAGARARSAAPASHPGGGHRSSHRSSPLGTVHRGKQPSRRRHAGSAPKHAGEAQQHQSGSATHHASGSHTRHAGGTGARHGSAVPAKGAKGAPDGRPAQPAGTASGTSSRGTVQSGSRAQAQ